MAVAFSSVANVAPATNNSFTISITVPSGNPVLMVGIGLESTTATVTSVSWSLGSGTAVEVKTSRLNNSFASVWVLPNPGVGAGTVTVNLSASVAFQGAAETFTGGHQTTPCPTADAVGPTGTAASLTITPANVTADDGAFGMAASTVAANPTGVSLNDRFKNNTTNVNYQCGDRLGIGALTANWDGAGADEAGVGVRIVTAPAGTSDDLLVRYGSMSLVDGSGLVTAAFADAAPVGGPFGGAGMYPWYYHTIVMDD
jgi:hypothetical protein